MVEKGSTQTYGINYLEKFALVVKLNSIRVQYTIVVNLDWPFQQLDVKNALLKGTLEVEVYMDPLLSFEERSGTRVCNSLEL